MLSQVTAQGLGGQGLSRAAALQKAALDIPTAYTPLNQAGEVVKLQDAQRIIRPATDVGTVVAKTPTTLKSLGTNALDFAKKNKLATGLGVLTGAQMIRDLSGGQQQATGTVPAGQTFDQAEYDRALAEQRPCLLYTSPSPRDRTRSRMPSSA